MQGRSRDAQNVSLLLVSIYAKRRLRAIGGPGPRTETKQA